MSGDWGNKLAAHQKQLLEAGGGPPTTTKDLMSAEDITTSTLSAESIEGFGGLEVEVQGNAMITINQCVQTMQASCENCLFYINTCNKAIQ